MEWTPEMQKMLETEYVAGTSLRKIAPIMSRKLKLFITPNMVIGRSWRLRNPQKVAAYEKRSARRA